MEERNFPAPIFLPFSGNVLGNVLEISCGEQKAACLATTAICHTQTTSLLINCLVGTRPESAVLWPVLRVALRLAESQDHTLTTFVLT